MLFYLYRNLTFFFFVFQKNVIKNTHKKMVRDWGKNREAAVRSRGQVSSRRLTLSNGVMDK